MRKHPLEFHRINQRFFPMSILRGALQCVQTSFERNMGSKLLIYNPFGDWGFDESTVSFLIDYLAVMGIYISGTHYILKFIQKYEKAKA
jgi:hypothetical protein